MKIVPGFDCIQAAHRNDAKRFPDSADPRAVAGLVLPTIRPKFTLHESMKVFTIGSCFARSIEEWLAEFGVRVPTKEFAVPPSEWPRRANGILNEFNPGTIAQRIRFAVERQEAPADTVVLRGDGYVDLQLPGGGAVTRERAFARRAEIDALYQELLSADLVVITLGLVEAWYDEVAGVYLNQMPDAALLRTQRDRYTFRELDVDDALGLLEPALTSLAGAGVKRTLITVSPVPLQTTFSGLDAVIANSHSKSVLRVCAQKLSRDRPEVDYFPSYEIVQSAGTNAFETDLVHVKEEVVEKVVRHMLRAYFPQLDSERPVPTPA